MTREVGTFEGSSPDNSDQKESRYKLASEQTLGVLRTTLESWVASEDNQKKLAAAVLGVFLRHNNVPMPYLETDDVRKSEGKDIVTGVQQAHLFSVIESLPGVRGGHMEAVIRLIALVNRLLEAEGYGHIQLLSAERYQRVPLKWQKKFVLKERK